MRIHRFFYLGIGTGTVLSPIPKGETASRDSVVDADAEADADAGIDTVRSSIDTREVGDKLRKAGLLESIVIVIILLKTDRE